MTLKGVTSGRITKPRKTLLYGAKGIGKTTWASKAPNPVFIQTEEGSNDLDVDRFPRCRDNPGHETLPWAIDKFQWCFDQLLLEEHDYKTLIIDSADHFGHIIDQDVCRDNNWSSLEDPGFGKGQAVSYSAWMTWLAEFDLLREKRGMSIILIAHEKIIEYKNPTTDAYNRYTNSLHTTKTGTGAGALIQEWCDEVLFATYPVLTRTTDKKLGQEAVKAVGGGNRTIYTEERPTHDAKNRLGLPYELPMDKELGYQVYANYIGQSQTTSEEE